MTEPLAGRRIVITGGLGLIGSALARAVSPAAADVLLVDALVPEHGGHRRNVADVENVRVVEADLRATNELERLLEGADVVFNLAGQRSHTDSMHDPVTDLGHNCAAQLVSLEACRTGCPEAVVVFASTRQVYGRAAAVPVDESAPVAPLDINGIHKAAAERYHALYRELYGLNTTVLRLTNTYGPGMRVCDARQGFIGAWVRAIVRGEEFEVWGGAQRRDFNFVDDVARAFVLAAASPSAHGGTFNLGGAGPVSLLELAELLVTVNGGGAYRVVPLPAEAAAIDIGDYAGNYGAFHAAVGWEPTVALADGLARTLEFYSRHGAEYWGGA